jgi:rhodanese-related sulfurtransferase
VSTSITLVQLKKQLASSSPPVLLEALPPKYYLEGHLPGAIHFPHDRVRALAGAIAPDKNTDIVVYCASASCRNSHIAATTLASLGYGNVKVFAGGKKEWLEASLPVETGGAIQEAA